MAEARAERDAADGPPCLICLDTAGVPRSACGHAFCQSCWSQYLHVRIGERAVLDMPCPAQGYGQDGAGAMAAAHRCANISRAEISAALDSEWLERYDAFVIAQRAERDPETRWCTRPGCSTVCKPFVEESSFSSAAAASCLIGSAAVAALPLFYPSLSGAIGLTAELGVCTAAVGAAGFTGALWHGSRKLGPRRRCECPTCGQSVCYDCKAPWHPGSMCEELHAAQLVRWCKVRDAGQCPKCGVFIERRAGCNHMDCRCGHSFCWLCLLPLAERCSCPQFGGRRTPDARARLASPGWRRSIIFAADAATLRLLFAALLMGAALQNAAALAAALRLVCARACEAPLVWKLTGVQCLLSSVHCWHARSALRVMPRRLSTHLAVRQLDISFGGLATFRLLYALEQLQRWRLLPPQLPRPPPPPAAPPRHQPWPSYRLSDLPWPRHSLHRLASTLVGLALSERSGGRDAPLSMLGAAALVHVTPAARDSPQRLHDHRPFALSPNSEGYVLTRRCRAALPSLAGLAFGLEAFLPAFGPLALATALSWATWLLVKPLGWVGSHLAFFASYCEPGADGAYLADPKLPQMLGCALRPAAYAWGGAGTLGAVAFACLLTFLASVFVVVSLLGTTRQAGLQRRVHARLAADPETELDELRLDGELAYSTEELRYDCVRCLLDARALLLHAQMFVAVDGVSASLWSALELAFGECGVRSPWSPLPTVLPSLNPLRLLWGPRLPAAIVCVTAFATHLEPFVSYWVATWTSRYLLPTAALLAHGFETLRLYAYLLVRCAPERPEPPPPRPSMPPDHVPQAPRSCPTCHAARPRGAQCLRPHS